MRPRHAVLACAALVVVAAHVVAQGPGPGRPGPGWSRWRPGGPPSLPGLTEAERQAFADGARAFGRNYTTADGLGPVFNDSSCAACHQGGGGSNRRVTRFGRVSDGEFDALEFLGGSLVQDEGIGTGHHR